MLSNVAVNELLESTKEGILQKNAYAAQCKRFQVFMSQDLEKGHFDVVFEIEGKKLHAHKFILTTASDTLDSMLSSRWTRSKDEIIKIETYSYTSFYQFLCFIYSGECKFDNENVFELVDIAEFYAHPTLKHACDKFLSAMANLSIKTIEEWIEFARKYTLPNFGSSLNQYIISNFLSIIEPENMLTFTKPFIKYLSMFRKCPKEQFFQAVYEWAETQSLKKQMDTKDETFNFRGATVTEMKEIIPEFRFHKMNYYFLQNFVLEKGFILSSFELAEFFLQSRKMSNDEQHLFKLVFEIAEKQALQKQAMFSDADNFDLASCIKNDLSDVIEHVKFYKMRKEFLMGFVVANGILTEEQASHVDDTRVQICNDDQIAVCVFKDDIGILQAMKQRPTKSYTTMKQCSTKVYFIHLELLPPKTPSAVIKTQEIQWYLCLEKSTILTFKHHSVLEEDDYLIAAMNCGPEFQINLDEVTSMLAFHNGI